MGTQSRGEEAGNTLVLKANDRRSTAAKRLRTIEEAITDELDIAKMTEGLRVLCARVAELTLISEELNARLITGKAVSVELIGRNTDRLQHTMKELRDRATGVRVREEAARARAAFEDDDDEEVSPRSFIRPSRQSRPRTSEVPMTIVDPRRTA